MPALTVSDRPVPRRSFATLARTRSTISSAVATSASTSASMNSSPPTRPHTSPARSSSRRAAATVHRASSPTACPRAPLIPLKSSRSSATTETGWPARSARRSSSARRSWNARWLSRPVSGSLSASSRASAMQVEVAREDGDLVAAAQVGAGAAVALADAVGDGADAVEPAHHGAAEQEADERAERERGAEAEQRERHPVGGAGAVECGQVVVQLEHRVRPGADRVVDLGVVRAARARRRGSPARRRRSPRRGRWSPRRSPRSG